MNSKMFFRKQFLFLIILILMATTIGCAQQNNTEPTPADEQEDAQTDNNESAEVVSDYPTKPIEFVLVVSPGGGTDIFSRNIAKHMSDYLGQDVRVVNYPGGAAAAASYIDQQPADGYVITETHSIAIIDGMDVPGTNLSNWEPIVNCQIDPRFIVTLSDSQFQTIEDVIEYAKDNPLTIGGAQAAGPDAVALHFFAEAAGLNLIYVPFQSTSEVITAAMAGDLDLMAGSLVSFVPQIEAGQAKAILSFHDERADKLPDVPTAVELGYDVVMAVYRGVGIREGAPEDVKERLAEAVQYAMDTDEYQNYITESFLDIVVNPAWADDAMWQLENYARLASQFLEESDQ